MALSERQQRILTYIRDYIASNGYPPSIREIGAAVGISSTSVVNYNLNKLEQAGLIKRGREVSRGIQLQEDQTVARRVSLHIPLIGRIVAGEPIPVPDDLSFDHETIEVSDVISGDPSELYALEVSGDSMIDALVSDGDVVILRRQPTAKNGDMVAAWLEDRQETTLKFFYHEGDRVRLQPANPNYEPIYVPADQVSIQGKVVAVIRTLD